MIIYVTQDHIKAGQRRNAMRCPVANAMKEATGKDWVVGAPTLLEVDWQNNNYDDRLRLPEYVLQKIYQFDETGEMTPFYFELDLENLEVAK